MKNKKCRSQSKKKRTARNRKSYLGLAVGIACGVMLFVIAFSVVPTVSTRQLAESVKAQAVRDNSGHGKASGPAKAPIEGNVGASRTGPVGKPNTPDIVKAPKEEYIPVGFDKLSSFPFVVTDGMVNTTQDSLGGPLKTTSQIPAEIKALNEKNVAIKGFMLPVRVEGGVTTEFIIMKSQGLCCYGIAPKITEWVNVRLAGKGVKPVMDQPVTVCGTFHTGELRENGELVGIYRLDCDHLIKP